MVTKCLDCMYARHNPKRFAFKSESKRFWSYKNFTTYIINAAGSIFLHNLDTSKIGRSFNKNEHPLAFLLKLSDELQDWERINQDEQYFSASHYAIEFDATSNILKVYAPGERVMRLKSALMVFEDIEFQVLQIATSLECQPAATADSAEAPPLAP